MAGSYGHVTDEYGRLESNETVSQVLDTGGDVYETIREMYAMIWYLSKVVERESDGVASAEGMVEDARRDIEGGLADSPGVNDE